MTGTYAVGAFAAGVATVVAVPILYFAGHRQYLWSALIIGVINLLLSSGYYVLTRKNKRARELLSGDYDKPE